MRATAKKLLANRDGESGVLGLGVAARGLQKKLPTSDGHETVGSHRRFDQLTTTHNPKDDHGTQYRSVVFAHGEAQRREATAWKERNPTRNQDMTQIRKKFAPVA